MDESIEAAARVFKDTLMGIFFKFRNMNRRGKKSVSEFGRPETLSLSSIPFNIIRRTIQNMNIV